ncbi:hypothetical protein [Cetobacterium somerae]
MEEILKGKEESIKINNVNIFAAQRVIGGKNGFKIFFLRNENEKNFLIDIRNIILDIIKKKKTDYFNINVSDDEVITFNANEIETWKDIEKEIKNSTPKLVKWNGTVNVLIYEVFTNIGKYYLFTQYMYNALLKKHKYSLFGIKDEPHIVNNEEKPHIVLDLNIHTLIKDDKLLAIHLTKTEEIFNFNNYYDTELKKEFTNLKKILNINETSIKSKKDKQCLLYGIKNGHIDKYINMSLKEKKIIIKEFEEAYKEKEKKDINLKMEKHIICVEGLNAKDKSYVFKLISNKAGKKILGKTLATTIE